MMFALGYFGIALLVVILSQWHPSWTVRDRMRDLWFVFVFIWPIAALYLVMEFVDRWGNRFLLSISRDREEDNT